jgi:hypothetical protein
MNDKRALKLIQAMVRRNVSIDKIEDAIWRLKLFYDKKARFF